MSLGEDLSLDDLEFMEDESRRRAVNNNRIVKIIKRHIVIDETEDTSRSAGRTKPQGDSVYGEADRDSASNRALAGDVASMDRQVTASDSCETASKKECTEHAKSLNSYEKVTGAVGSSLLLVQDFDAYSVSIVSDTDKSINPSMAALVGSIK